MTGIGRVQAQLSVMATESAAGDKKEGRVELEAQSKERTNMRAEIQKREAAMAKLQEELANESHSSTWDDICNFFTGGDNGVAETGHALAVNAAEMERAQNELKIAKAKSQDALDHIKKADDTVEKTYSAIDEMQKGQEKIRQDGY
jgi:septal ring factor EnvC (AmiA/AmiB activator)